MHRRLGQMERRDLVAYIRELEEQVMPDHDNGTDRYTDVYHAVLDALLEHDRIIEQKRLEKKEQEAKELIDFVRSTLEPW